MDADDVVLEYLRSKLSGAKDERASKLLSAVEEPSDEAGGSGETELSPEDMQALMTALEGDDEQVPAKSMLKP